MSEKKFPVIEQEVNCISICDRICKKGLPHTSDLQTSTIHNFEYVKAIDQHIVYLRALTQSKKW